MVETRNSDISALGRDSRSDPPSRQQLPPPGGASRFGYSVRSQLLGRHANGHAEETLRELFLGVDVRIGGEAPCDPQVSDARFYRRVLRDGSLGLGESYVDGWWDVVELDSFVCRIMAGGLARRTGTHKHGLISRLIGLVRNPQGRGRAARNARAHYERGPDLFRAMLDERMTYSSGYWKGATTLGEAQDAKLDLICRKLGLTNGGTLLDIGCGWGSLVSYAAERYGVRATGITVCPEQADIARRVCQGLPVKIEVRDYRTLDGKFDAVVSVGMFEHVGPRNHSAYMEAVERCLGRNGVSLLHSIAGNFESRTGDPWIDRYVFPAAVVPTVGQIARAAEGHFVLEDIHSFGPDYDRTLREWHRRFEQAWPTLRERYDERFHRLWRYYLLSCAGAFRARAIQVVQILMTRPGKPRPDGADIR